MLGIVGLGAASELVTKEQEATAKHMARMRDALQHQLVQAFPSVSPQTRFTWWPYVGPLLLADALRASLQLQWLHVCRLCSHNLSASYCYRSKLSATLSAVQRAKVLAQHTIRPHCPIFVQQTTLWLSAQNHAGMSSV